MYNVFKKTGLLGVIACAAFFAAAGMATAAKVVVRIDEFKASPSAAPYLRDISFQELLKSEFNKLGKIEAAKRDELTTAVEEIQNSQSGLFAAETAQQLGGFKSAQLGLSGSLELIDRERDRGMRHQYTARVALQCLKFQTATESTRSAEVTDYVQTPSDLFAPLAEKVAREFTLAAYPIKVAAVDGGNAVLNYGNALLRAGDRLEFFAAEDVRDPDTGEVISTGTRRMGTLRVSSVAERSATAEIVEGMPDIGMKCTVMAAAENAEERGGTQAASATETKKIAVTGEKPTLFIGKFKYSNEFNLSQTAGRTGKAITSGGAGQGSGGVLGALVGGVISGGRGALAGAVAGGVVDSERRHYEYGGEDTDPQMPQDQRATAIAKESQVLREMVVTKAQKSGKFTVIEQARMDEIKAQMAHEMDGDYDESSLARRGRLQAAKYSVFGTITRFESARKQTSYSIIGGDETATMKMTLDLRLVDNELGTVVASDQVTAQINTGNSQVGFLGLGTASESQGEIGQLLDTLAQNVIAKVVMTLWPIKVVAVNTMEKIVTINAGDSIVWKGERLMVYGTGGEIVDPETGEVLGKEESTVGEIEVYDAQPRFSKCRIIRPSQRPQELCVGQICRPAESEVPAQPVPASTPTAPAGGGRRPAFTF